MVLTLKRWKSRSSPGIAAGAAGKKPIHMLPQGRCRISPSGGFCVSGGNPPRRKRGGAARQPVRQQRNGHKTTPGPPRAAHHGDAGWSSPVARQAHNLKVAGSNPAPATNTITNQPPNTAGAQRWPQQTAPRLRSAHDNHRARILVTDDRSHFRISSVRRSPEPSSRCG